jgi:hypothetical protein
MFKKARPARSALNQAGGIMDSSPELMQTVQNYPVPGVQKFANGTEVRIPGELTGLGTAFQNFILGTRPGQRYSDENQPTYPVYRVGGGDFLQGRGRKVYNKAYPGPEYAADFIRSQEFGEGGRKLIDRIAGYPGAFVAGTSGGIEDLIGVGQSILGYDDAAVRSDKRADKYYNNALDMLLGKGATLTQPEYGTSDAEQQFLQDASVEDASSSKFDASLPFGGMLSSEELAKHQALVESLDAQNDENALQTFEARGANIPSEPDEVAVVDQKASDQASVQNREAALYGPASGFNDYLERLQSTREEELGNMDVKKIADSRERVAAEEARLKKIKDDETAMRNREKAFEDTGGPVSSANDIKKQVQSTVISGSPQEKQKDLKQLMAEFTDNTPKYEGMNKGLAIAKIGFAIAAGDSPNAMTNIARGLSQGADEFIKDKANRDAFDRQVQLSALQYGLGEQSKLATQRRADDRNFFKFVATEDGTFNGEAFKKGQNIRVSMTDIMANGGRLPAELQDQELYLENVAAVNDRNKLVIEAADDLRKEKVIKDEAAKTFRTDYSDAASKFKSAERGITYLERIIGSVAENEVTGGEAAFKDLFRKGGAFFGIGALQGQTFKNVEDARTAMSIALQPLIKVTLGETQSANSISNRDVDFLIQAVYGPNALSGGSFSFATSDTGAMITRLKGAMQSMRDAQKTNLNQMKVIEDQLVSRILPGQGKGSGMTVIRATQEDVSPYLPGGEITAQTMGRFQVRDDGTYDIVYD